MIWLTASEMHWFDSCDTAGVWFHWNICVDGNVAAPKVQCIYGCNPTTQKYTNSQNKTTTKTNCLLGKLNNDLAIMTDNLPPNLETHGWVHPIRWPMCRYYSWPCLLLLLFVLFAGYGKRKPLQLWGGIWFGLSFVINPIRRWTLWTIANKMTLAGAGGTVSKNPIKAIQSNVNWVACGVNPVNPVWGC